MNENISIDTSNLPVIALVGRVNVGKSTLFNKLIEANKAIVSDVPGTTRTSNEGLVLWRGKYIKLIDTGGLTFTDDILFEDDIIKQSIRAIKEADIIVFVADAKDGILPQEQELAKLLRKYREEKPVLLVANKVDNEKVESTIYDPAWGRLALGEPIPVSAASGRGVGDFLDVIYKKLGTMSTRPKVVKEKAKPIQVSLMGKPNVGKSSLFNKIIGEDKVIVSDVAHTTREPHDTLVTYKYDEEGKEKKQQINFVDTAGIRRKSKVDFGLEREGIMRSIKMVDDSDIILFALDASEPFSSQDMQLGGLMERHSKSVIILINKWDLSEDNSEEKRHEVIKMTRSHFPHLKFAPIIFVSGLTGYSVHKIFPEILKVWKGRQTALTDNELEVFLKEMIKKHAPSRGKGVRQPKLLGLRQLASSPPIFEMFVKHRTSLHRSYLNFLENKMRERFDFHGTPIVIKLTKTKR